MVEGDPALAQGVEDRGQHGQAAGDGEAGAGGVAGDAGLVAQPGAGVPEPVEAPDPQLLDRGEQFGFLGVQGGSAAGEVPGPVREGPGSVRGELFDELSASRGTNICT